MALGARGEQVCRMMLSQGMALVLVGLSLGVLLVIALGRFIEPALFQVSPRDPVILGGVAVLMVGVAAAAALAPALRAARVDPVIALRSG
jgi:ABC-type antimicrobial peptide transport system permease subunit